MVSFVSQRKPIVSRLFGLIQAILPEIEPQQARDQAYLAESVDIYDLERRMRQVDSGRHNLYAIGSYGIFMR